MISESHSLSRLRATVKLRGLARFRGCARARAMIARLSRGVRLQRCDPPKGISLATKITLNVANWNAKAAISIFSTLFAGPDEISLSLRNLEKNKIARIKKIALARYAAKAVINSWMFFSLISALSVLLLRVSSSKSRVADSRDTRGNATFFHNFVFPHHVCLSSTRLVSVETMLET